MTKISEMYWQFVLSGSSCFSTWCPLC